MLDGENGMFEMLMPILSHPMNMSRIGAMQSSVKVLETIGGGRTSGSRNLCLIAGFMEPSATVAAKKRSFNVIYIEFKKSFLASTQKEL